MTTRQPIRVVLEVVPALVEREVAAVDVENPGGGSAPGSRCPVPLHQRAGQDSPGRDGQPVISVDAKKKEQLGQLPAAGREWRPKGDPVTVDDHSFFTTGPDVPLAVPYGIYDIAAETGWVNVGVDHDTSAFAVASIRRWWHQAGQREYPGADRLLITADAGGSNSYRYRLWKAELAAFAAEAGLHITICHIPPGTSKWNKIEHRLFSAITLNWRGRPLTSHQVVVATINTTRTRRGLVHDELDENIYPLGIANSKQELRHMCAPDLDDPTGMVIAVAPGGGAVRWPRWLRVETTPRREMLVIICSVLRLGLHGTIWTWSTQQPRRSRNLAQTRPASATSHHRA